MTNTELRSLIKQELPLLLETDPEIQRWAEELVRDIGRHRFVERKENENRFDSILAELRAMREADMKKWEEQERQWEKQNLKWSEANARFECVHEEIMAQAKQFNRQIGALGSRWGMQSEAAFRNALAGILEKSFGVDVININEYDESGEVFGRPEQIELDIIIKNGTLLICELKSSIDKAGMYIFERKARYYEKHHQRKAERLIVISPMVDQRAQKVAEKLNIEVYSDSSDVKEL